MNPTAELVLKHKKANMRKSEFLMLEALKSAPHLNDSWSQGNWYEIFLGGHLGGYGGFDHGC
jgi:hypothetical protein